MLFQIIRFEIFETNDSESKELSAVTATYYIYSLWSYFFGDLDEIRTHDLRRDRAAF